MKKLLLTLLTVAAGFTAQATDYELITSNDALEVGANYILVANDGAVAMGIYSSGNNVPAVSITAPVNNVVTINDEAVGVITLESSGREDGYNYQLKVEGGYLYAASTSKNYMKVKETADAKAQASITVAETGVATIKFDNKDSSNKDVRNWVRFNPNNGSPIFACYTSGQQDVYLYKEKTGEEPVATVETPEITPATGKFGGPQQVTITCATEGAAIYYTTDGTAPTNESTLYEAPFTVSETATVKAIAYVDTDASKVASSTITILDSYNSLADLLANGPQPEVGATSEEFIVNFDLIVSYVDGANVIVTDNGTNYTLIYKYDTGLQPGDVVAGGWVATAQNYKTQYELVPAETLTKNGTTDVPAFAECTDMSQLTNADIYHIVVVKNVYFAEATPDAASNFTATQNGENYTMYNKFKLAGVEAGWYDVTLVVWMYSSLGYYPIAYEAIPQVAAPVFSEAEGELMLGTDIYITCATEGATIEYSNDGENWHEYSGEALTTFTHINYWARATKEGYIDSEVTTAAYQCKLPAPEIRPEDTTVMPGTAIEFV
ncbi:MAG: chitobiase/beta-hexosaminidase C-terminal domain-containing protein, partial [Muribaculaceae bacterium]